MKYTINILCILIFILAGCKKNSEHKLYDYPLSAVPINQVELTDHFWLPIIKTIQKTTIQYAFDKCETEGRMDNFLIAGGKMKGPVKGEMPFDDTDLYKIIEGASYSLISNPDPELEAYLDSIIAVIKTGQEPDGYITTWFTIDPLNPPASWVKPSTHRWENEISSHELYNSGHLFEAAAAHYIATGKRNFLDIALKNADLLVENFGPGKLQIVPGHQIVETGLIKLYLITGNRKYLELSKDFLDWRGDTLTHKLFGSYSQDHLPVVDQDEVVGHAVRAVYMYAAMTDIAAIYHDAAYRKAVNKLWNNMVHKKLYITGGIGARHEGESFGDNYELPNLTAYSETCAAIGSVYWNQRMFLLTGDAKYYDVLERTLYNGLIAGISTDGTKFFYPNPLESDGEFTFNHGSCARQPWFDCSCCPTNLIRFIPSIPDLIYAQNKDTVYINLYMSNSAELKIGKSILRISQQTDYPWKGDVKMNIDPKSPEEFTLRLRIPYWVRGEAVPGDLYSYIDNTPSDFNMLINDEIGEPEYSGGYVSITRKWSEGDKIELQLPMKVKRVIANDSVEADRDKVALEYGPLVYCVEEIDNGAMLPEMIVPDTAACKMQFRTDLFGGINTITENAYLKGNNENVKTENSLKTIFIPYYLWSNRGVGEMKVWLPRE